MEGGFFTLVSTFFKLFFIHVLWIRNFVVCLHHRTDAVPNKHHKIMKARASHTGKVIVKGSEMLKGRGIQYRGMASNGEHSFLLTESAYSKISHKCKWEK